MKLDSVTRRLFLQGVGSAALALPFLPSLMPRDARAQTAAPLRFVGLKSWNVPPIRRWYPRTTGIAGNYTVRQYAGNAGGSGNDQRDGTTALTANLAEPTGISPVRYQAAWAPLSDFITTNVDTTRLSDILGPRLNPFRDKLLLLRGLDFMPYCNHNNGGWLGNFAAAEASVGSRTTPTLDQVLAYSSRVYPTAPLGPRSLNLAPGNFAPITFSNQGNMANPPQGVSPTINPRAAWDAVFTGFQPGGSGPTPDHPRKRLVDRVLADYNSVRNGSRIGAEDRRALDRHISFMNDVEARLRGNDGNAACSVPGRPGTGDTNDPAQLRAMYESFLDVIAAAIMCDVTRVFTLNVFKTVSRVGGGDVVIGQGCASCNTGFGIDGAASSWHGAAHDYAAELGSPSDLAGVPGPLETKLVSGYEWIASNVFTALLARLDVPEANGRTYLDNSVVLWGNEMGMNHINNSIPTLLAGRLGGYLDTGKYIDYMRWSATSVFSQENGLIAEGAPYNRLLIALLQGFGLSAAEYQTEPNGVFGESRNIGKSGPHWDAYDLSTVNRRLHGVATV